MTITFPFLITGGNQYLFWWNHFAIQGQCNDLQKVIYIVFELSRLNFYDLTPPAKEFLLLPETSLNELFIVVIHTPETTLMTPN